MKQPKTIEEWIQHHQAQLDRLQCLVIKRNQISAEIDALNHALAEITDAIAADAPHGGLSYLQECLPASRTPMVKLKFEKRRPGQTVVQRLVEICKSGATKSQIMEKLGVSRKTVEAYLYSKKYGHRVLDKTARNDGVTVWTSRMT